MFAPVSCPPRPRGSRRGVPPATTRARSATGTRRPRPQGATTTAVSNPRKTTFCSCVGRPLNTSAPGLNRRQDLGTIELGL